MFGLTLTRRGRLVRAALLVVTVALVVAGAVHLADVLAVSVVPVSDAAWQAGIDAARERMGR